MNPKEKAYQLVEKYKTLLIFGTKIYNQFFYDEIVSLSKLSAMIAVNEILESLTNLPYGIKYLINRDYWFEVKQEIEKL